MINITILAGGDLIPVAKVLKFSDSALYNALVNNTLIRLEKDIMRGLKTLRLNMEDYNISVTRSEDWNTCVLSDTDTVDINALIKGVIITYKEQSKMLECALDPLVSLNKNSAVAILI